MGIRALSNGLSIREDGVHKTINVFDHHNEVLFQAGIEIGTLESFFSFEDRSLGRAQESNALLKGGGSSWKFNAELRFESARVQVSEFCRLFKNGGVRALSVRGLERSYLMDSVVRFVIPKQRVKQAAIGSRIIAHDGRNKYHQFPSDIVKVVFVNGVTLRFYLEMINLPSGFTPLVYLRDEPDNWILHFRALALAPDKFVLKGCFRWYNRPVPSILQRMFFLAFPQLLRRLLFVRERISQRIPFQVNGAAVVEADEEISLTVRWVMEDA